MGVPTSPNPIYIKAQQSRHAYVEPNAWAAALTKIGFQGPPTSATVARALFDKAREAYWPERLRLSLPGEFNGYNVARMRIGKPPIGPDGFPIELDHREYLSKVPQRALDPTNIWELFRRQHDFQHGEFPFRWHQGSFPESPHTKGLSAEFGDPLRYKQWP
jgi:hypothetical protein